MNKSTIALLDDVNTVYLLTKLFYRKLFEDPVLNVLFVNKDIEIHHKRMAWFILEKCKISNEYSLQRGVACGKCKSSGQTKYTPLMEAHKRAKSCPLRDHRKRKIKHSAGVYGGHFTVTQKNNWLNHFESACDELKLNKKFKTIFLSWLKFSMPKYGPFVPDRVKSKKQKKLNNKHNHHHKEKTPAKTLLLKKDVDSNTVPSKNNVVKHVPTTELCSIS
eukprot:g8648.t1